MNRSERTEELLTKLAGLHQDLSSLHPGDGPYIIGEIDKLLTSIESAKLVSWRLWDQAEATTQLSLEISKLRRGLEDANASSSRTGSRLNQLTWALAICTGLLVLVGGLQGWQSWRQADLLEKQLNLVQGQLQKSPPNPQDSRQKPSSK